jgi:hypothetical protein
MQLLYNSVSVALGNANRDTGMKMLYNGLPELGVDYQILILHPLSGANEVSG